MNGQDHLPQRVNQGNWVTAYTLDALRDRDPNEFILPIVSLGTPPHICSNLGNFVLPPLFHEALDEALKRSLIDRIRDCFPVFDGDCRARVKVVELPRQAPTCSTGSKLIAFSVDTAVEEHGPHLPLGTDTIQSYAVLNAVAREFDSMEVCQPVDYGQLTWGLPFGFSIDVTATLLTQYVANFARAIVRWKQPSAIYVVDVHGSLVHRNAIVAGLQASGIENWSFRWLHEPLVEFASQRGDQHAGGVETSLIEYINPELLDASWWPAHIDDLADRQLSFPKAVELSADLRKFVSHVRDNRHNGIVGDIKNYRQLDASRLFALMTEVANRDVAALLAGKPNHEAGANLW